MTARKAATPPLPAAPPVRIIPEPMFSHDPTYFVGKGPPNLPTVWHILRETWVRNSQQKLVHAGRGFWAWTEVEETWRLVGAEEMEVCLYDVLRANRCPVTPAYMSGLLRLLRLELHWPRSELCRAA